MSCDLSSTEFEPIVQTADYSYELELSEKAENGTVTPLNLTDTTWRAQIRRTATSNEILGSFSVAVTDATGGKATLSLSETQTAGLPISPCDSGWAHDVFVRLPDGRDLNVVPLTQIPVLPAVSRV